MALARLSPALLLLLSALPAPSAGRKATPADDIAKYEYLHKRPRARYGETALNGKQGLIATRVDLYYTVLTVCGKKSALLSRQMYVSKILPQLYYSYLRPFQNIS